LYLLFIRAIRENDDKTEEEFSPVITIVYTRKSGVVSRRSNDDWLSLGKTTNNRRQKEHELNLPSWPSDFDGPWARRWRHIERRPRSSSSKWMIWTTPLWIDGRPERKLDLKSFDQVRKLDQFSFRVFASSYFLFVTLMFATLPLWKDDYQVNL
jgi:hypothetical protein